MRSTRLNFVRSLALPFVLALVSIAGLVLVPRAAPEVSGEIDPARANYRDRELLVVPLVNPIFPPLRLFWRLPDQSKDGRADVVLEASDGVALGPADSVHDDIAALGGGRFSIWNGAAYVSVPAEHAGMMLRWKGQGVERPWIRPMAIALAAVAFALACRTLSGSPAWRRSRRQLLGSSLGDSVRNLSLPILLASASVASLWALRLLAPAVSGEIDLSRTIHADRELRIVPLSNSMSPLQQLFWRLPDQARDGEAGVSVKTSDGFVLGPPDCMHEEIAARGGGRFSVWNGTIHLSVPAEHVGKALRWEGFGVGQAWVSIASFALWLLAAGLSWWVLEPAASRAIRRNLLRRVHPSRSPA